MADLTYEHGLELFAETDKHIEKVTVVSFHFLDSVAVDSFEHMKSKTIIFQIWEMYYFGKDQY